MSICPSDSIPSLSPSCASAGSGVTAIDNKIERAMVRPRGWPWDGGIGPKMGRGALVQVVAIGPGCGGFGSGLTKDSGSWGAGCRT